MPIIERGLYEKSENVKNQNYRECIKSQIHMTVTKTIELKHRDSHIDTAMRIAAKSKLVVDWYNFSSNGSAITVPL